MQYFLLLVIFVSCISSQNYPIENGWSGIVVFESTQPDVENILGKPLKDDGTITYKNKDVIFRVAYSGSPCSNDGRGRFKVSKGSVINYEVILNQKEIYLDEIKWDKEKYERYEDKHILGLTHYYSSIYGIRINTIKTSKRERIQYISFEPTVKLTEKFSCKNIKNE